MAAVAAAALLVLQYARSQKLNLRSEQTQAMISIVLGLLAGRCFLSIWYFIFEYHLHSRAAIVVENGFGFFFDLYDRSIQVFWLTPGIPFLAIFLTIVGFWIYEKNYLMFINLQEIYILNN
jgi:hypothetical protein